MRRTDVWTDDFPLAQCCVVVVVFRKKKMPYIPLISRLRGPYGKLWTEYFPSLYGPSAKQGRKRMRIHNLPYGPRTRLTRGIYGIFFLKMTKQTRLIRCLLYGLVDYSGKGTKSFDVLTGDQELEVCTATYAPEIDQSQHTKPVSHMIK